MRRTIRKNKSLVKNTEGEYGWRRKFQIFISSTYEDLKEERAKLVATILKDYHFSDRNGNV